MNKAMRNKGVVPGTGDLYGEVARSFIAMGLLIPRSLLSPRGLVLLSPLFCERSCLLFFPRLVLFRPPASCFLVRFATVFCSGSAHRDLRMS